MSYTLTLTTESYLLTGSGEGGVLIDADVVFHPTGFPMIPARRIKGMIKESMEEVMEMTDKSGDDIQSVVKDFFGDPGQPTYQGKLLFHNLILPGWPQITKELSDNLRYPGFQPDFIKSHFTAEIQQTAIGREGKEGEIEGVSKKRSLRNYRVIKPGIAFEGMLETTSQLSKDEEHLLRRAILNLRHAGTRRNRGFGKVKCGLQAASADSPDTQTITAYPSGKLLVTVSTQSPVVLAEQLGDQNTVFTRKHISGNQIRGLLANAYIRKRAFQRTVPTWIRTSSTCFSPAMSSLVMQFLSNQRLFRFICITTNWTRIKTLSRFSLSMRTITKSPSRSAK
ncbi:MAG: RAMP superfamily CRISPR-associated protein [Bacteroidia bacterium]